LRNKKFIAVTNNVGRKTVFAVPIIEEYYSEFFSSYVNTRRNDVDIGTKTVCNCQDAVIIGVQR